MPDTYVGDQITIESSTDTVEDVKEALGSSVEIEEGETEEQPPEKPKAQEAEESEEGEEEEESEDEAEEEAEEKPKKQAPATVPRSRLNEEIRRRKDAERRLSEKAPAKEEEKAEEESRPQNFSGKLEPKIEDFENQPTKFPDPYAAFIKEHGAWIRLETRGEIAYENQQAEAKRAQDERTSKFVGIRSKTIERHPDYNQVVAAATDVNLSDVMTDFVYESDCGPDLLYYLAEHPEEVDRIIGFRTYRGQVREMEKLETEIAKTIEPDDAEREETEEQPTLKRIPPKKAVSKAPAPPSRLKPAGPGPKSLRELAGPEDRTGIDIEFSPELERAEKAKRST